MGVRLIGAKSDATIRVQPIAGGDGAQRRESESRISSLLESNTQLTQQITTANQTLMEKLALLTPTPLPTPEVAVVVVPESDVVDQEAVETESVAAVEEQAPVARRKRRIL